MKKKKLFIQVFALFWAFSEVIGLSLSGPGLWSRGWLHLLRAAFLASSQFLSTASESLSSESALGTQLHWLAKSKYTDAPFKPWSITGRILPLHCIKARPITLWNYPQWQKSIHLIHWHPGGSSDSIKPIDRCTFDIYFMPRIYVFCMFHLLFWLTLCHRRAGEILRGTKKEMAWKKGGNQNSNFSFWSRTLHLGILIDLKQSIPSLPPPRMGLWKGRELKLVEEENPAN